MAEKSNRRGFYDLEQLPYRLQVDSSPVESEVFIAPSVELIKLLIDFNRV